MAMAVGIDDLLKEIEKATTQQEQCQTLLRLQECLQLDNHDTGNEDADSCANDKKKNETAAVQFLLQRMVPIDSNVYAFVQDVLSACSRLLVWDMALDTLHALARQRPTTGGRLTAQQQQSSSFTPLVPTACLETTCKALLRLLFSPPVAPPPGDNDHDHDDDTTKLPFVVQVVLMTPTKSSTAEQRRECLTLWIQSVLRLPLLVANACDTQRRGLPRIWITTTNHDRGFYGRLLKQAMDLQSQSSSLLRQEQQAVVEEYALLLMTTLIRQRGATETVARVFSALHKTAFAKQDHLLRLISFLSQEHYLSPRQCATLWKAFWQCSQSSPKSSSPSDWGMASGRVLLASHAVQEATIHEMLFHTPTTTQTEIHGLVQVLLSLEQGAAAEMDEEESDDEIQAVTDPPEWTYGQCTLARHATLVARQWSSKSYIRQTDPSLQLLAGQFLEMALVALRGIDLSAPLVLHIVDGVSPRLESLQPMVRQNGMRVAEAMAHVLGQDLSFDELRKEDNTEQSRIEEKKHNEKEILGSAKQSPHRRQRQKLQSNDTSAKHVSGKDANGSGEDSDESNGDDESVWDDCDEDFQPYDLEDDEEDLRETARPTYLRDCLDLLRTPESEDFARSHHETALQELPALVHARPIDLVDVAPSLAMQVLRMENKFNLDEFGGMVSSCLVALVVEQPMSVGETLINEIFREGSLADRLKSLGSLGEGAYELSGYKDQEENKAKLESTQRLLNSGSKISGRRTFVPDSVVDSVSSERTRRWGKKEIAKTVVNRFSTVAPMWFYALLRNFIKRREDAVLWGGSVGSMLLSKLLLSLAMIVELSGRGRSTETMAKDLFDCVWGFHQAEISEVRIASLCAVTAALSNMQDDMLLQILYEERAGNLSSSLKQIVTQDPDQECRNVAATIAKNVARALESMGPLLIPAA